MNPSRNPPVLWVKKCHQFTLAVFAKEGVEVQLLFGTRPTRFAFPEHSVMEAEIEHKTQANKRDTSNQDSNRRVEIGERMAGNQRDVYNFQRNILGESLSKGEIAFIPQHRNRRNTVF